MKYVSHNFFVQIPAGIATCWVVKVVHKEDKDKYPGFHICIFKVEKREARLIRHLPSFHQKSTIRRFRFIADHLLQVVS